MRNTPETDAIVRNAKIEDHPPTRLAAILTVKCEKLERERDEAREECDELKQLLAADSERVDAYLGVCMERDEARSVADGLAEQAERLRKERDEAREQVDCFREKHDLTPMCWNV